MIFKGKGDSPKRPKWYGPGSDIPHSGIIERGGERPQNPPGPATTQRDIPSPPPRFLPVPTVPKSPPRGLLYPGIPTMNLLESGSLSVSTAEYEAYKERRREAFREGVRRDGWPGSDEPGTSEPTIGEPVSVWSSRVEPSVEPPMGAVPVFLREIDADERGFLGWFRLRDLTEVLSTVTSEGVYGASSTVNTGSFFCDGVISGYEIVYENEG